MEDRQMDLIGSAHEQIVVKVPDISKTPDIFHFFENPILVHQSHNQLKDSQEDPIWVASLF